MTDTVVTLEDIAVILDGMTHGNSEDVMGFDMGLVLSRAIDTYHPCGTACCIGGWVQYLNPSLRDMGIKEAVLMVSKLSNTAADDLCFSQTSCGVTPQQGAQAIRNALKFGSPRWEDILGKE
jgi:hypothetical protein